MRITNLTAGADSTDGDLNISLQSVIGWSLVVEVEGEAVGK